MPKKTPPDAHNRDIAHLLSVGFAVPPEKYTQPYMAKFASPEPKIQRFFEHDHIQYRHLIAPPMDPVTGRFIEEPNGQLLEKFRTHALKLGDEAIQVALKKAGLKASDIDFLCCVTSTGFIVPALSALYIRDLGFRRDCQRIDIVGMGCNGGLNGLNATASWCSANPGKNALIVCCEICSAIYSIDDTQRTAIVNSLFGDGVAAAVLRKPSTSDAQPAQLPARILGFASFIATEHMDSLRFDWDETKNRYSFYVGKETPRLLAENAEAALHQLLDPFSLKSQDIDHWVVHSGGAAILEGLQANLGITRNDLRHTYSVLKDFGNVSSGSFLFSYSRLLDTATVQPQDLGVMMTMGPGLTIELALVTWT